MYGVCGVCVVVVCVIWISTKPTNEHAPPPYMLNPYDTLVVGLSNAMRMLGCHTTTNTPSSSLSTGASYGLISTAYDRLGC